MLNPTPSPNINGKSEMCLKYWTWIGSSNTADTADVRFRITSSTGKEFDSFDDLRVKISQYSVGMWFYKRTDVTVSPNDVINIEASKRITGSVLAFDDIQLQNQACESPGWCDFENGKPNLF